ncbi:hypothetical protein GCM10007276_15840 [Agaricicola taiwanensis]|uniref:DUF4336 domain-containing protein n=1 Tax=Agaricicola taiwanensis TaxID=591372 RepID=A0A8J2VRW3_9RHOB|nr:DUF4336 domain-containing protein [Agaricicola taiwanensis]GGE39353.1 hypothetical protein GCM10007276_15840 [Agaricicola taiwanensis]
MSCKSHATYPPLNTLKVVAPDVWIVDGPLIEFGMPWPKMPFPTRMTVIRLADGLFIHSPTPLVPDLKAQLEEVGQPRWIIGPNRIHYWWIPEWRDAYPGAEVYLAPGIREQAKGRIDFPARELAAHGGYPWDGELSTVPVSGSFMTEIDFFHHASRTLVLTDLIENFEPARLHSVLLRWLTRLGGVQDPHGSMPRDMRMTFFRKRKQLKAAVEKMIAWDPERIILAHGRWYEQDGAAELRRAFRWLLD